MRLNIEDLLIISFHLLNQHCVHALLVTHWEFGEGSLDVKVFWKLEIQQQNISIKCKSYIIYIYHYYIVWVITLDRMSLAISSRLLSPPELPPPFEPPP